MPPAPDTPVHETPARSGAARERRPWGPALELTAWIAFFLVFIGVAIAPAFFRRDPGAAADSLVKLTKPAWGISAGALQLLVLWIAIALTRKAGRTTASLGWTRGHLAAEIALGVAAFAAFYFTQSLWVGPLLSGFPKEQLALPVLDRPSAVLSWGVFTASVALMEEGVLRGYGYGVLNAYLKQPWISAVLVSGLFGVAHLYQGWGPVVALAIFGFYLNALLIWRRSLVAPILVHFLNDFLAPLLARHAN